MAPYSNVEEARFRQWYQNMLQKYNLPLSQDPYAPAHMYDYKVPYEMGAEPTWQQDHGQYRWPDEGKAENYPVDYPYSDLLTEQINWAIENPSAQDPETLERIKQYGALRTDDSANEGPFQIGMTLVPGYNIARRHKLGEYGSERGGEDLFMDLLPYLIPAGRTVLGPAGQGAKTTGALKAENAFDKYMNQEAKKIADKYVEYGNMDWWNKVLHTLNRTKQKTAREIQDTIYAFPKAEEFLETAGWPMPFQHSTVIFGNDPDVWSKQLLLNSGRLGRDLKNVLFTPRNITLGDATPNTNVIRIFGGESNIWPHEGPGHIRNAFDKSAKVLQKELKKTMTPEAKEILKESYLPEEYGNELVAGIWDWSRGDRTLASDAFAQIPNNKAIAENYLNEMRGGKFIPWSEFFAKKTPKKNPLDKYPSGGFYADAIPRGGTIAAKTPGKPKPKSGKKPTALDKRHAKENERLAAEDAEWEAQKKKWAQQDEEWERKKAQWHGTKWTPATKGDDIMSQAELDKLLNEVDKDYFPIVQ